jgi:hypothetical protein
MSSSLLKSKRFALYYSLGYEKIVLQQRMLIITYRPLQMFLLTWISKLPERKRRGLKQDPSIGEAARRQTKVRDGN